MTPPESTEPEDGSTTEGPASSSEREAPPAQPSAGAPWDLPIAEAPLCFVDLEMTGLDAVEDRVIEICAERWVGGERVDALTTLVQPDARIGENAHIHGLDAAALAEAPPFAAVLPDVLRVLDGGILVAHAAPWDVRFLEAELARAGQARRFPFYLDTLTLARRAFALPRNALGALAEHFGIDRGMAHRAASDVRVLRAVFERCASALAPVSARDLWEVRVGARRARAAIVEACEAAAERKATVRLVYRPRSKPPEDMIFVVQDVRADVDPPRVMGYQLPGRGRRELRADRILRIEPGT